MKHLKRFNEAFIIPKIFRKFIPTWEDEDVALKLLDELKKLPATEEVVEQLMLRLTVPNTFQFKMGEYFFSINNDDKDIVDNYFSISGTPDPSLKQYYSTIGGPARRQAISNVGASPRKHEIDVSDEVTKQIIAELERLLEITSDDADEKNSKRRFLSY
jgi:hypothetical protein